MDDATRQRVLKVFSGDERSRWPITAPERARALLADHLTEPAEQRARNSLVNALNEGVPAQLDAARSAGAREATIVRLSQSLVEDHAMQDAAARWAVETWAAVLGLSATSPTPTAAAPTTAPPARPVQVTKATTTAPATPPRRPPPAPPVSPESRQPPLPGPPVRAPAPAPPTPSASSNGLCVLQIWDDEGKSTRVPIARDEITIGRKDGNTIRLTERNVSRRHARITRRPEGYRLEDLASYNGIVVNGRRLAGYHTLASGDVIEVGDYTMLYQSAALAAPSQPPARSQPRSALPAPTPTDDLDVGLPDATRWNAPPEISPMQPALGVAAAPAVAQKPTEVPETIRGLRLVFLAPAGVPPPVTLDRLPLVLGRAESTDVPLPFSSLSREHARIFLDVDELMIEDLGSSNGVLVNGQKTLCHELDPGDFVQLGVVEFKVVRSGDSVVETQRLALAAAQASSAGAGGSTGLTLFGTFATLSAIGWAVWHFLLR